MSTTATKRRTTLARRVAKLRQTGMSTAEIARRAKLSESYVYELINDPTGEAKRQRKRDYRRRNTRPCPRCGHEMPGRNDTQRDRGRTRVCASCWNEEHAISDEDILDAIRWWHDRYGEPPTSRDWGNSGSRTPISRLQQERLDDARSIRELPSVTAVTSHFGSWPAAIEAAGLTPRVRTPQSWDRDAIVRSMRTWEQTHGQAPTSVDWSKATPETPSTVTVARHFRSFPAAVKAAGLKPPHRRWDATAIVEAIRAWAAAHGHGPRGSDWDYAGPTHPASSTVRRHFGSFPAAVDAAGVPRAPRRPRRKRKDSR